MILQGAGPKLSTLLKKFRDFLKKSSLTRNFQGKAENQETFQTVRKLSRQFEQTVQSVRTLLRLGTFHIVQELS